MSPIVSFAIDNHNYKQFWAHFSGLFSPHENNKTEKKNGILLCILFCYLLPLPPNPSFSLSFWIFPTLLHGRRPPAFGTYGLWDFGWITAPLRDSVCSSIKGNSPSSTSHLLWLRLKWKCRCPGAASSGPFSVPLSCFTRFIALAVAWIL